MPGRLSDRLSLATSTPAKEAKAKGPKKTDTEEQAKLKENRRWFNSVVDLANEAIGAAEVMNCTPEERSDLLRSKLEPDLFETVSKGGDALCRLADWLKELFDEAGDTLVREGVVRTSPAPVSARVQPPA